MDLVSGSASRCREDALLRIFDDLQDSRRDATTSLNLAAIRPVKPC